MPGPVYHGLIAEGHEALARDLSRMLDLRATPDRLDVEEFLARWDREAEGPQSGYDWLAAARLWSRAGRAAEASSALDRISGGVPEGLILLERARVGFLTGDGAAGDHYWRACDLVEGDAVLEAWLDVEVLATPGELDAWDRLRRLPAAGRGDCSFLRRFWNRRAAASGSELGARIAVHYARVRYALGQFVRRGRDVARYSAQLGRPRNAVFDDRGLLYVRMGSPDETASFLGDECLEPNVTWRYARPDGDRLYHLAALDQTDNWWLVPNLAAVYRCGGGWERNPFTNVPPLLISIPGDAFYELYMSRMGLDPAYARIALHGATASRPTTLEELTQEREWTWEAGRYAIAGVPERPSVDLRLNLGLEWLQFRSARPGRTRVWLNGSVDTGALTAVKLPDGRLRYRVDAVWTVLGEDGGFFERFEAPVEMALAEKPESGTGISIRVAADLPPGSYAYLFSAADPNVLSDSGPVTGGYAYDSVTVRDLGGRNPLLSDVAVAADSGGSWSPGGGIFLQATPVHTTGSDGVAFAYFEAYNLTAGGAYQTRVRLRAERGGAPFDLRYPGTATSGGRVATRGVLRIDLSATEPGAYEMSITTRDLTTGLTTLPVRTTIVVDGLSSR